MKKFLAILFMLAVLFGMGCTSQQRAKKYGGSATVNLPSEKKLVIATWKGDNLWLLYRDRRENEPVETYSFKESSSWGVLEGTITIKER